MNKQKEAEYRQMFRNLSDCYAEVTGDDTSTTQAMSEDRFIEVVDQILLTAHESNHGTRAHCANAVNGEVPHENDLQNTVSAGAGDCETGSERQNEQTQKVCRCDMPKKVNYGICNECGGEVVS